MLVRFHVEAREEFDYQVAYYNSCEPGLGYEFSDAVELATARIAEFPDAYPLYLWKSHRFVMKRFPFAIVYRKHDDELLIVAVAHVGREPGYWMNRTQ